LLGNDRKVNPQQLEGKKVDSNILSEAPRIDLRAISNLERHNIPLTKKQAQNEPNFVTLSQISEEEKKKVIETGFQLQVEYTIIV